MVALIARMLVCSASSLMISRMPPICWDLLAQVEHVLDHHVHLLADGGDLRPGRGRPSGRRRGPPPWLLSAIAATRLGALGDLPRRGQQLPDRGRDLGHRGDLLLRPGGLLVGRRLEFVGRALHVLHGRADLPAERPRQQVHEQRCQGGAADGEHRHQQNGVRGHRPGTGGSGLEAALLQPDEVGQVAPQRAGSRHHRS